jgi:acyl carrier protein
MDEKDIVGNKIRAFLIKTFPAARKRGIDDNVPLLGDGIVDSLGMLDVVAFLEQTFEIKVLDEELTPANFASVKNLAAFVETKRVRAEVPAE